MRNKGFTLIELLITIAFLAIVGIVIAGAVSSIGNNSSNVSFGVNGIVEMRCINGLEFTISNGRAMQVYDQFGHGVVCNQGK